MPYKIEKGIRLDFPTGWEVVKYDGDEKADNVGFYRQYIESQVQQIRGVDVVGQEPGPAGRLLLIEIKDYRISRQTPEDDSAKLRQTVMQKALNTLSGLFAAARVGDNELRPVVTNLLRPDIRIEVILFLERLPLPEIPVSTAQKFRRENPLKQRSDLELQLSARLNALGLAFLLRSSTTMKIQDGWTARVEKTNY